jgi:hypothetical protein
MYTIDSLYFIIGPWPRTRAASFPNLSSEDQLFRKGDDEKRVFRRFTGKEGDLSLDIRHD